VSGLYWLQRKAKDLIKPRVLVVPGYAFEKYPGCYYHPRKEGYGVYFEGRFILLDRGLIIVSESVDRDKDFLASTLAHEWRHHWQWFNFKYRKPVVGFDYAIPYPEAIVKFYRNRKELDALLFSHEVAPCDLTRLWKSWVDKNA